MGPYSRGTTQGIGGFFDLFFQYPVLMVLFVVGAIGVGGYLWIRNKQQTRKNE